MEAKSINEIKKENLDEVKEDISKQLEVMQKATNDKMKQVIEHFVSQCEGASKKYLSVNGFLQALQTIVTANGGTYADLMDQEDWVPVRLRAAEIANKASELLTEIGIVFETLCEDEEYERIPNMLDKYMNADFTNEKKKAFHNLEDTAWELCKCSILANLQPSLDDMHEFYTHAQSEMNKLHDELIVKA